MSRRRASGREACGVAAGRAAAAALAIVFLAVRAAGAEAPAAPPAPSPGAQAPAAAAAAAESPPSAGSYAVVVSAKTNGEKAWRAVVDALRFKYGGAVITWQASVRESQEPLAALAPNYTCFVAQPEECGREFVVAVHRLTRRLDADPYTDTLWGILTGYSADDALRIARQAEPLALRKVLAGTTGAFLQAFREGVRFDEGKAGVMLLKTPDGRVSDKGCPPDSTQTIVDYLNKERPDCLITSGHATQRDWQIGYSFKAGQLRCRDGALFGLDAHGRRFDIFSPNPKVFLPVGNCLIGDVSGRDCMVAALIHSAGVVQMFGYTVPTWYGKGGWGVQEVFLGQPGRFTLAEAFFLNTQVLLHEIETRYPRSARADFEQYNLEQNRRLLDELAARHGLVDPGTGKPDRDELGLLWDRDTVAFYGDPAWAARPAPGRPAWDQALASEGGTHTFTITPREGRAWPEKPVMALLPQRVTNVRVVKGGDLGPVVADNFILVPMKGEMKPGEKTVIVVEAGRATQAEREKP